MNAPTLRLPKHSNLDSDQQRLFIRLLSPKVEGFTLQTFPDNKSIKDRGLTRVIQSFTHDELLQLHAHGAGIYATVNETDGKGRKSENILSLLLFEAAQVFENHQRFPSHQDAQR